MVLAGLAAYRDNVKLVAAIALGSAAGFASDKTYLWLGRRVGTAMVIGCPLIARLA